MAVMHPTKISEDSPQSEKDLFGKLKELPDRVHAFHSVLWQSRRGRRQGDGEADFIVVDPQKGILIVEVKGGGISINDGQWTSTGKEGTFNIKNPFKQAQDSKYALLDKLEELSLNYIPICHAVAFPDQTEKASIGMYGSRPIIWYRNDLHQLSESVRRTFSYWESEKKIEQIDLERLKKLLAPTVVVRKKLVDQIEDTNKEILTLTKSQISAFKLIKKNRRAIVSGGAGTGKTILAIEKARQLSGENFSVLFVCYNDLLSDNIRQQLCEYENVDVTTFHSLCVREGAKNGAHFPATKDRDWWDTTAPDLLIESASKTNLSYDAIIVDEGQDFSQYWLDSLLFISGKSEDPLFYVFKDSRQDLYSRVHAFDFDFVDFDLDVNCRNTIQIANKVSAIFEELPCCLGAEGPKPVFIDINNGDDPIEIVQNFCSRILSEEYVGTGQIVVISNNNNFLESLRSTYVDDTSFTSYGKFGIACESIKKFKGLESDVVIAYLDDRVLSREDIYVSMSRAKTSLFLLGSKAVRKKINW